MTRLHYNGMATAAAPLTLGAALTSGGTTITFNAALKYAGGVAVPTVAAPNYIPLAIVDPVTLAASEVVWLTAYTAGTTTGTIARGKEGTTGVAHATGERVVHGALVEDVYGLPRSPATGKGGIPGAFYHSSGAIASFQQAGGITRYFPFAIDRAIAIPGATSNILTAGTAGTLWRGALLHADSGWQPDKLISDFGTVLTDSTGTKTYTTGTPTIGPGRYLIGHRAQTAALNPQARALVYNCPEFATHDSTNWGQVISGLTKTESYAAFPDPPANWDTIAQSSSTPTFTCPIALTWTDA